jgi:hypothetical protein
MPVLQQPFNNQHGSRTAVLRRSKGACFSSPCDDEVDGYKAIRAERAESERSNQTRHRLGHEMPSSFSMVRSSGRLSPTTLW